MPKNGVENGNGRTETRGIETRALLLVADHQCPRGGKTEKYLTIRFDLRWVRDSQEYGSPTARLQAIAKGQRKPCLCCHRYPDFEITPDHLAKLGLN